MKIAIIPARSGSKRIKNKNIIKLNGKPLISYTIKNLIKSKIFDLIIVSSDSDKIMNLSKKAGARIFFRRPKNLANDYVGTFPVINHAINFIKKKKFNPKYICCVYPTSIMLKPKDIKESFVKLSKSNCNFIFSVTDYGHPPQRGFYLLRNKIDVIDKKFFKERTQDLNKIYHDAGQFYWGKTESWLKNEPIFTKKSLAYILPRNRAIDVDDMEDLRLLKKIFKSSNTKFSKKK
jgi:N-acylneuraminate cytidylyltransferase